MSALLGELEETLCVDVNMVYATGISNGGMIVQTLGCNMADRFAAIAPVAGTLARGFNCSPSQKTSIMDICGTKDTTVPPDGSKSSDGYFYVPVRDVLDLWACDDPFGNNIIWDFFQKNAR